MNDVQKITEWSKRIHELALAKGWWQGGIENRSVAEIVANFHGEISEAWEEYRAGRMDLWWKHKTGATIFLGDPGYGSIDDDANCSRKINSGWKPEGFWVEIADLCIRIMDAIEAYKWEVGHIRDTRIDLGQKIPELIADLHKAVSCMILSGSYQWSRQAKLYASCVIADCISAAKHNGIDLWALIELKHAYNETRPYRHNGKLA